MNAVILAGGLGTRLRPLTYAIPKPLIPVGKKPILEIIIGQLQNAGFVNIILSVGYKAELIEAYFGDGSKYGVNIVYFKEDKKLGTAGPLNFMNKAIDEPFLVMNGDILTKANFKDVMDFHINQEAEMTVGVKKYEVQVPYGVVTINGDGIEEIEEKPLVELTIVAGIYILNPSVIDVIPKDTFYGIPNLVKDLLNQERKVVRYLIEGYWSDLGNIKDFEEALKTVKVWEEA